MYYDIQKLIACSKQIQCWKMRFCHEMMQLRIKSSCNWYIRDKWACGLHCKLASDRETCCAAKTSQVWTSSNYCFDAKVLFLGWETFARWAVLVIITHFIRGSSDLHIAVLFQIFRQARGAILLPQLACCILRGMRIPMVTFAPADEVVFFPVVRLCRHDLPELVLEVRLSLFTIRHIERWDACPLS